MSLMSHNISDKIDLELVSPRKALAMGKSNMDYKSVDSNVAHEGKGPSNPKSGASSTYKKRY